MTAQNPPTSIEAMAIGFLVAQLHQAQPEFAPDRDAEPCRSVFWPFLGHRFRITVEEILAPPIPDTADRRDAAAAVDAALGRLT